MKELIPFELKKLVHKKLVIISFLCVLLASTIMIVSWGTEAPRLSSKEKTLYSTAESLAINKAFFQKYEGKLTDEKVNAIVSSYQEKQETGEPCTYLESTFEKLFTTSSGEILPIKAVFPDNYDKLNIGNTMGWDYFIYAMYNTVIFIGIALIIILSPLFSDEYTTGMDGLILSSKYGKTKCAVAKIISGFLITAVLTLIIILFFAASFLLLFGTDGWNAHIQLAERLTYLSVPGAVTCLQAALETIVAVILSLFALSGIVMLFSALSQTSFTTIILSAVFYVFPLLLRSQNLTLTRIAQLFPVKIPQIFSKGKVLGGFSIGGGELSLMVCTFFIVPACVIAAFLLGTHIFAKHQVRS